MGEEGRMVNKKRISIILPVYNEECILGENIPKIISCFDSIVGEDYEIVIADDGSTDDTPDIAKNLAGGDSRIKYFKGSSSRTRREILGEVIPSLESDIIAFMDMDLATDLKHARELIDAVENQGYSISTGSRWMKSSKTKREKSRFFISLAYNNFVRLLFGSRIRDHQCGFKAFRREAAIALLKEMGHSKRRGWSWDTELLIRAQKKGRGIYEFPVCWNAGQRTSFKFVADCASIFAYLIYLRVVLLLS